VGKNVGGSKIVDDESQSKPGGERERRSEREECGSTQESERAREQESERARERRSERGRADRLHARVQVRASLTAASAGQRQFHAP
jgi:hypothetical protein